MAALGQQGRRAVQRHQLATLEHANAVAQRLGFFKVVGGQQHSGALLFVEAGNELPQGLAQFHVHAGRGLIQHDDRRAVHQRLRHQHAALHAAAELAHVRVGLVQKAQVVEQLLDPALIGLHTEVAALKPQGLAHAEEGVEHQLLRHHTEAGTGGCVVAHHVVPQHTDTPRRGRGKACKDADQAGFSGTVGAQEPEEFAGFDVKADIGQGSCLGAAVGFSHPLEADGWGRGHVDDCRNPRTKAPLKRVS